MDKVLQGESVYAQYKEYRAGAEEAEVLFLISPASFHAEQTAAQFAAVCEKIGKCAYCTNEYKDCGYLLLTLAQTEEANNYAESIKEKLTKYTCIVTDDSFVLDALLIPCLLYTSCDTKYNGRVFACGDVLGGQNFASERSGAGIAAASAYLAGKNAAAKI